MQNRSTDTKTPRRRPEAASKGPRVRWKGFRPLYDFWGHEIKRFYKLETLASAVEWSLQTRDRFILPSVQDLLGPGAVTTLSFELFQEGKFQLIFRLKAGNARRKEGFLAFVVAKRTGDFSVVAAAEHRNLEMLNARARGHVVRPFRGGNLFLPDRHRRAEHGREVYAYLTQWLNGYHELGVAENLHFIMNIVPRHTFSLAQTDALKGNMIEIIARSYDPRKGECMEMPQIASGDFVVTPPGKSGPRLKLIACRRFLKHVTPAKLIHKLASASWPWGDRTLYLMPEDPDIFFESILAAAGEESARAWLTQYADAVSAHRMPEPETLPVELVSEWLNAV